MYILWILILSFWMPSAGILIFSFVAITAEDPAQQIVWLGLALIYTLIYGIKEMSKENKNETL